VSYQPLNQLNGFSFVFVVEEIGRSNGGKLTAVKITSIGTFFRRLSIFFCQQNRIS
jgi:hypothetical protein